MKTFEEFAKDIETDETLKAKVTEAFAKTEVKTEEAKTAILVQIAKENGYEASVEDFTMQMASCQALDEDELQTISGGRREPCVFNYVCMVMWNTCMVNEEQFIDTPGHCKGNLD